MSTSAVVNKNNQGVAALQQGFYGDAMQIMREATMSLNEMYQMDSNNAFPSQMVKVAHALTSSPVGAPNGEASIQANTSVFQNALILSSQEVSVPVIASVVLYNLALCHHLIGTCLNSSERIAAALKFYKMSYQVLEDNRQRYIFADLLVLALVNNIAEASFQLSEVGSAQQWYSFLSQMLGVSSGQEKVLPSLTEDDYIFFHINASLHQGKMLNLAPAA